MGSMVSQLARLTPRLALYSSMVAAATVLAGRRFQSDCPLEEGIPVCFVVGSFLEKAMSASCPAVAMPNI